MNYAEVESFLFSSLPMFQRIGAAAYKADLSTTLDFCAHLNQPQDQFPCIHIAGTNGKGSVSHTLASVFMSAGYTTGLFTSPHLISYTERIKVNGKEINQEAVVQFVNENKEFIDQAKPSFFEMTAVMAFWYFARQKVDIAIIETGMGGRLDSTNVIKPKLSIITNIGLDHTEFLGPDLPSIAAEKAGIIKPNTPVLIGLRQKETEAVFIKKAKEEKAFMIFADQLLAWESAQQIHQGWKLSPSFLTYPLEQMDLVFPLAGWYQKENTATVLAAIQLFLHTYPEWNISTESIQQGFEQMVRQTGLRGRWEVLGTEPLTIADTAHNPPGWKLAMEQLTHVANGQPIHMVFGVVQGKDVESMIQAMPSNLKLHLTCPEVARGMPVQELFSKFPGNQSVIGQFDAAWDAYQNALNHAASTDVIYIGGSTFIVADIMKKMFS